MFKGAHSIGRGGVPSTMHCQGARGLKCKNLGEGTRRAGGKNSLEK